MKAKKKVWPRKAKLIVVPVFGLSVYLCLNAKTWTACCDYFTDQPRAPTGCGGCMVLTKAGEHPIYLLGVFDRKAGTLVHELAHLCFFVLRDSGAPVDPEGGNETFAYLQDDLFSKILPMVTE